MVRIGLLLAAFFAGSAVGLGAFAAHALNSRLSAEYLAVFQTGVHYQMFHALALLALVLLARQLPGRLLWAAGGLFSAGIVLFSGSLYALTLSGVTALGMLTPLGGMAFLLGWLCLGIYAWQLNVTAT